MESVPITTTVVSSNPVHDDMYSIQHYVIKFVSDFRQISGFLPFPRPLQMTPHDITEILLKVALNTTILNLNKFFLEMVNGFT